MIVVLWMVLIAGTMWKGYKYPPEGTPVEEAKDDPGEVMQL
uniref:SPTY2D1 opposite strand n=1 Tax=Prolemur simus TaxID=1328070 RepID=A0A8C9AEI0_PROSS